MTNPQKRRGDSAEREVAHILADLLGSPVRRKLGAGRADDTGDIHGLPDTVIQVKSYKDIGRALREGLADLPVQQANAGAAYGVAVIRHPGGRYTAAMPLEAWVNLWREAMG